MDNLARTLDTGDVFQTMGRVRRVDRGELLVETPHGDFRAKRAVSCLVEPQVDDFVLLAGATTGKSYVLSVLEREDKDVRLSAEGDMSLVAPAGKVRVAAKEGIDMVSNRAVSIGASELSVRAAVGSFILDRVSALSGAVNADLGKVRTVAVTLESIAERVSQRVKRSFRTVEEFEQLKAKQIDYKAEQSMTLRSDTTFVQSKELVRMDAEQIHVG